MGLFDAFKKKECSVCGGEIGLLGNRKLEDGNLCKNCAAKLSPFFSDRRGSTVEEIKEQLSYREENRQAVAAFHTTRSLGRNTKVLLDEDAGKFMVTGARDLAQANPDVLDFSQVTGCELDIDENLSEEKREDSEEMGREIREALTNARRQVREEARAAAAPRQSVTCPWCGATTTPDASGCCEYCGGAVNG